MFNIVTMPAREYRKAVFHGLLAYLPITCFEDVRLTCRNTVNGNWMLSTICDISKHLNGLLIKKIINSDKPSDKHTPMMEWESRILYDSPKRPAKILPAAIPLVIVLDIPASRSAIQRCWRRYCQVKAWVATVPETVLLHGYHCERM